MLSMAEWGPGSYPQHHGESLSVWHMPVSLAWWRQAQQELGDALASLAYSVGSGPSENHCLNKQGE